MPVRLGSICCPLRGHRCWAVEDEHLCFWLSGRGGRRSGWIVNVGVDELFAQGALDGVNKCFFACRGCMGLHTGCLHLVGEGKVGCVVEGWPQNSESVSGESVAAIRVGMTACQADHAAAACRCTAGAPLRVRTYEATETETQTERQRDRETERQRGQRDRGTERQRQRLEARGPRVNWM